MSIEKSIFISKTELSRFVETKYGILPIEVERLYGGSANCYKLTAADACYFLKEFPSNFNKKKLIREAQVCQCLDEQGIPTCQFIKTLKNDLLTTYRGRIFHLQQYLSGRTLEHMTKEQLCKSAHMLGKIHNALKEATFLRDGFPDPWFDDWTKEKTLEKHRLVLEDLPNSTLDEGRKAQVAEACRMKMRLVEEWKEDCLQFKCLTKVNTHGDYNNLQLLWTEDGSEIKAVVDFSSAARLPAVWEVIRSYSISEKASFQGGDMDVEGFWQYFKNYLEEYELTEFDVQNMSSFYYYNLLRSTFGLNSSNKNLVDFALWRAKMCQYLAVNHEKISAYLLAQYRASRK